jgi:hypothetical protein
MQELFNLRHAQARNVIERIFGVVKRRFGLMTAAPEYSLETQAKMVPALCVLHNFIRVHDPDDTEMFWKENELVQHLVHRNREDFWHAVGQEERTRAGQERDRIAKAMWQQYQEYLSSQ